MAYIDLTKITDIHAKDIITNDSALANLALNTAELETRVTARELGVKSEDIPLYETTEHLVSEALYMYCQYRFLFNLFSGVTGTFEINDEYKEKLIRAEHQGVLTKNILSYEIITETEVVDPAQRNKGIPIL